ncbi:hypothetical protein [Psychroserpens sp. NJDZ02]|uniref:hypothetical protein n=1 Tax=Psychroserpens sp. NJDZ02 TaxID=2570561 RepID=UPI0010A80278|nr:hypothetical protein [Psychroserpens sp. NJDZ02]QCE40947.1 hypothetical protein E9099_05785 [Psychroserpens sp. NJDZ02]
MLLKKLQNAVVGALFILTCSCQQSTNNQQANDTAYKKQLAAKDSLITILTAKDSVINTLSKQLLDQTKKTDSIKNFNLNNYINVDYVSFLFKETPFLLDKSDLVKTIITALELNQNNVLSQAYETGFPYTAKDTSKYDIDFSDKLDLINYIWNIVDRSPESINTLLTDTDKRSLYALFKSNTLYKDSGIEALVKGLITAHDEIENIEESKHYFNNLKPQLYDSSDNSYYEARRIVDEDLTTSHIKEVLSDKNYNIYSGSNSHLEHRIFFVYSFWARRQTEGNQDIVYQLLKELDHNVSPNLEEY